jgi:hypothetical protein
VVRCVKHYFAIARLKSRPTIWECAHLIGLRCFEAADAKWAIGTGQIRAMLAIGNNVHHGVEMGIASYLSCHVETCVM